MRMELAINHPRNGKSLKEINKHADALAYFLRDYDPKITINLRNTTYDIYAEFKDDIELTDEQELEINIINAQHETIPLELREDDNKETIA